MSTALTIEFGGYIIKTMTTTFDNDRDIFDFDTNREMQLGAYEAGYESGYEKGFKDGGYEKGFEDGQEKFQKELINSYYKTGLLTKEQRDKLLKDAQQTKKDKRYDK